MTRSQALIPFRRQLLNMVSLLLVCLALLVLPFEIYRPYDRLDQLTHRGGSMISGLEAALSYDELSRLNEFALKMAGRSDGLNPTEREYRGVAFNMLLQEGEILPASQAEPRLANRFSDYRHRLLEVEGKRWRKVFEEEPDVRALLLRYKTMLLQAKERSQNAGFNFAEIYIALDSGEEEGLFDQQVIFVIDGFTWWELGAFPGESYDTSETPFMRRLALAGKSGYDHNPMSPASNLFLPEFERDEWGTWYSVWRTMKNGSNFNMIVIDIDAGEVLSMMGWVLAMVLGVALFSALSVYGIAVHLSRRITRPIDALTLGVERVGEGDYTHQVEVFRYDELGQLTQCFNSMVVGQQERLNLKSTLEKLLSKELADMAGREGLMLGGQNSECTLMFTDFAGFSTLSRQMAPGEAVDLLNLYFERLVGVIKEFGGFPDKYIGDAIVVIFGAPIAFEDHAEIALRCAVRMQQTMREINRERRAEGLKTFEMRVGLNTGKVLVGAIGCDMKLEYTSIGETTNLANRMESICPIGHIAMAKNTYDRIDPTRFNHLALDAKPVKVRVKGYPDPVPAYRLFIDYLRVEKVIGADALEFYRYGRIERPDSDITLLKLKEGALAKAAKSAKRVKSPASPSKAKRVVRPTTKGKTAATKGARAAVSAAKPVSKATAKRRKPDSRTPAKAGAKRKEG